MRLKLKFFIASPLYLVLACIIFSQAHCVSCSSSDNVCSTCSLNYYFEETQDDTYNCCFNPNKGKTCLECYGPSSCTNCNPGYLLFAGYCISCSSGCQSCQYSCSKSIGRKNSVISTGIIAAIIFGLTIFSCCCICICYRIRKRNQQADAAQARTDLHSHQRARQALYSINNISSSALSISIDQGKWKQYNDSEDLKKDCVVCLESNLDCQTNCGHQYHRKCIIDWYKRHKTCPQCRRQVQRIKIICMICLVSYKQLNMMSYIPDKNESCSNCKHNN